MCVQVLLENKNSFLPLNRSKYNNVVVIGPAGDYSGIFLGDYFSEDAWQKTPSAYKAIKNAVSRVVAV